MVGVRYVVVGLATVVRKLEVAVVNEVSKEVSTTSESIVVVTKSTTET